MFKCKSMLGLRLYFFIDIFIVKIYIYSLLYLVVNRFKEEETFVYFFVKICLRK